MLESRERELPEDRTDSYWQEPGQDLAEQVLEWPVPVSPEPVWPEQVHQTGCCREPVRRGQELLEQELLGPELPGPCRMDHRRMVRGPLEQE